MTFEEILAEHGLDPVRASGGRELIVECPFCSRNKLYVNAHTGLWQCFRCDERGNKWSLLERVVGLDPIKTGYYIRRLDDVGHRLLVREAEEPIKEPWLPTGFVALPPFFGQYAIPGEVRRGAYVYHKYLAGRKFASDEIRTRFKIGYAPGNPAYDWRVIVPVVMHGKLQSFVARSIYDECFRCHAAVCECPIGWQRVLYPPGSKMSELLFNLDSPANSRASRADSRAVVLVEGVFDAMRIPDRGVATFGAHLSQTQRSLLRQAGVETVTIMFDGDEAGREGAQRATQEFKSDLFNVRIAHLPDGADPASLTEEEALKAISESEWSSFSLTHRA